MANETLKKALLVYRSQKQAGVLSHALAGIGSVVGTGLLGFGAHKLNQWDTNRIKKQLTAQGWQQPKPETRESIHQNLLNDPVHQRESMNKWLANQENERIANEKIFNQLADRLGYRNQHAQQSPPPHRQSLNIQPEPAQFNPYGRYGVNNWADMQQPLYGPRR